MNAVLKYPGSKWRIAKEIVSMIPRHHSYLEPYFGSGAVFFNKIPSAIETINDLDNDVPNLFRCIRENPDRLASIVTAIPYSRYEYEAAYRVLSDDEYDRAVSFLIRCWMGYGYRTCGHTVGWKNDVQGRESMYALRAWYSLPDKILMIAERLKMVQIENRPALDVVRRFNYPNVFMYIDPPYVKDTRLSKRQQYKFEMTNTEHVDLLEELKRTDAKVMISGYESELYNDILTGWDKVYLKSNRENGAPTQEVIWMNYKLD